MIQWTKINGAIGTVNKGVPTEAGLCTLCDSACKGKCETWLSSHKGRKLLYPRNFGQTTSGAWHVATVGYHSLRIQGYANGAKGIEPPMTNNPDDCLFTNVNITTEFGNKVKTKCRLPIMTGPRKFNIDEIAREDIVSANRETEKETGITFMTDAKNDEAMEILKS